LFVGLCVLSRARSLAGESCEPGGTGAQALAIAQVFARQARRRMANNVRRIERNEDEQMDALAGFILGQGRYPWDVIA
jgi:acyl-CoA dehydrogenase family protein 9